MDLNQLLTSVQNVLDALEESDLETALENYRQGVTIGVAESAEQALLRAADKYMNQAAGYSPSEVRVAQTMRLGNLQSPGFWFDLCAAPVEDDNRLALVEDVQSHLGYSRHHLPALLALAGNSGVIDSDLSETDLATIRLRIHDAVEKSSFPDRISRLIDAVDMIYQSCAELAGESGDGLELLSITGQHYRTVVFKGHVEVATATRRIIRTLTQQAARSLQYEEYLVDDIAEQIPFMHAIDELFRVNALDAHTANSIREGVLAGSIMLLECGARIVGDVAEITPGDRSQSALHSRRGVGITEKRIQSTSTTSDMESEDELEYLIMDLNKKYKPDNGK